MSEDQAPFDLLASFFDKETVGYSPHISHPTVLANVQHSTGRRSNDVKSIPLRKGMQFHPVHVLRPQISIDLENVIRQVGGNLEAP